MSSATLPRTFKHGSIIIPCVGFGTFQGRSGNGQVKEAVIKAIQNGYRHIDTAAAYGNEQEVGEAIKESGIPREELFVTTKLAQTWHEPSDVEDALDQSLKALQLDYGKGYADGIEDHSPLNSTVDLYLMHFPHAYAPGTNHSTQRDPNGKPHIDYRLSRAYPDTWKAMENLVDKGKTKMIGLSNFNILKTKRILDVARIRPAVNQVEVHPYFPQRELVSFCEQEGIHITAHQPLGGRPVAEVNPNIDRPGPLLDSDIAKIATSYGKTPAQVILSWAVQRGLSVVPKTVQEKRMVENRELFRLSDEHMAKINQIPEEKGYIRFLDPRGHIGFDIFDEENDQPVIDRVG